MNTPAEAGTRPLPPPTWRLLFVLAVPVLAQQALVLVVNQSDRYLAGHLRALSPHEQAHAAGWNFLAAANLAAPGAMPFATASATLLPVSHLHAKQAAFQAAQTTAHYLAWFIHSYTILVTVGGTALVARFIGAREPEQAVAVLHQTLLLAVVLGIAGSAFGLGGGIAWMVDSLQLRGDAATFAIAYLRPLFALLVCQIVEAAGIACLVGVGDTRTGLGVTAGIAVVNLPLAWSFCLGLGPFPALGFVGIATGTACTHALGALAVLAVLARGRYGLKLHLALFRPRFDLLYRLLRVSLPAGVDSLSLIVGQFWYLSLVNRLGEVASAAHGIAIGWEALGYQSGAAFGTAAMTLVGQNLGAARPDRARRAGWMAFAAGCGTMTLMGLIFFLLAEPMFRLFCPLPEQAPIVAAGVPVLRLVAFAMPMLASTIVFSYALRGAGDTRVPVLFTFVGFFAIRIPLAYLLAFATVDLGPLGTPAGFALGLFGTWLAMVADLALRGVFFLVRFARGAWIRQTV